MSFENLIITLRLGAMSVMMTQCHRHSVQYSLMKLTTDYISRSLLAMWVSRIAVLAVMLVMPSIARANSHDRMMRSITQGDGLRDATVSVIYKDSLGYIWFGTTSILERFDGVNMRHFPIPGDEESAKWIGAIGETDGNCLWVGTGGGLWRLDKNSTELVRYGENHITKSVNAFANDGNGNLYIGGEEGLFMMRNGKLCNIAIESNVLSSANKVNDMTVDESSHRLYVATDQGVYSLDMDDGFKAEKLGDSNMTFSAIYKRDDMLYLGTRNQGLWRYDLKRDMLSEYADVGSNVVMDMFGDGNRLYVATDGNGLQVVDMESGAVVDSYDMSGSHGKSIRSNSVYSALRDREGQMWLGFYQLGVDFTMYSNSLFETYAYPPHLDTEGVLTRTILADGSRRLIGFRDGFCFIDEDNGTFKRYYASDMRSPMVVSSIRYDGKYLIGTYGGGLYVFDPERLILSDFEPGYDDTFKNGHIFDFEIDRDGDLWICTSNGLFRHERDGNNVYYNRLNSKLPEGNIFGIFFDSTGRGWICGEKGLCLWDAESRQLVGDILPDKFIHNTRVRRICETGDGRLLFIYDKNKLFGSDTEIKNFGTLTTPVPLDNKDMDMLIDKEGWIWLITTNGLYRWDGNKVFYSYNFNDGLLSQTFFHSGSDMDDDGRLWLCSSQGLVTVDIDNVTERQRPYRIAITDASVNGIDSFGQLDRTGDNSYEMRLDNGGEVNLAVKVSGFNYSHPGDEVFQYKLDNAKTWSVVEGQHSILCTDLGSGHHTLVLRYPNEEKSEVTLDIFVARDNSAWLWVIVIALSIFGAAAAIRVKLKHRKERKDNDAGSDAQADNVQVERKYRNFNMSDDECRQLLKNVEEIMRKSKAYADPDLKLAGLASLVNTTPPALSYMFNQYLNTNYYDYINNYRIEEFKRLVSEPESEKYTLSALAAKCGFSSRASFFRYFKRATSISPSEYVKSIGKNNRE